MFPQRQRRYNDGRQSDRCTPWGEWLTLRTSPSLHLLPACARETPAVLCRMGAASLFTVFFCAFTALASIHVDAGRAERVAARVAQRRAARIAARVAERVQNRIDEAVQETADECAAGCYEDAIEIIKAAGEDEEGVEMRAHLAAALCSATCYDEGEEAMEEAGEYGFVLEDLDGAIVAQGRTKHDQTRRGPFLLKTAITWVKLQ